MSSSDDCVICLERISDEAVALPCKHQTFDFACLGQWSSRCRDCPLCKRSIVGIKYHNGTTGQWDVLILPPDDFAQVRLRHTNDQQYARPQGDSQSDSDDVEKRRAVYRKGLMSMYVGSNRLSQYQNFTPASFRRDENRISKARNWIRRELRIFEYLQTSSNPEFLLEYIISILKTIDLKTSSHGEEMLSEFLGQEHARIFLHEVEAWIRSPYTQLKDWDLNVQYTGHLTVYEEQ